MSLCLSFNYFFFRVIPPAFYDRDGTLFQPPPFDIEINKLEDVTKEQ